MASPATPPDEFSNEFIDVARVLRVWGPQGEVLAAVLTDFPDRFAPGAVLQAEGQSWTVEAARPHQANVILKLRGVDTPAQAGTLVRKTLQVPLAERRRLKRGEYYLDQIVGLQVRTTDHEELGVVEEVLATGANDVYRVVGPRGEVLVPAIRQVVKRIDLKSGVMLIELWDGMVSR